MNNMNDAVHNSEVQSITKSIAGIALLLEKDPELRRGWVDNIACILMDTELRDETGTELRHNKLKRDAVAEEIVNFVFGCRPRVIFAVGKSRRDRLAALGITFAHDVVIDPYSKLPRHLQIIDLSDGTVLDAVDTIARAGDAL